MTPARPAAASSDPFLAVHAHSAPAGGRAAAPRVETPKKARESLLRTVGEYVEAPISMLAAGWESVPALNRAQHPAGNYLAKALDAVRKGGPAALNAEFDPFGDASLRRAGVDPAKVPGWVRGVGELGATWYSPGNVAIGKGVEGALGLGRLATHAARRASPAVDAAASAVEHASASAKAPFKTAVARAKNLVGNAAAKAITADKTGIGAGLRGIVDRYYAAGLPQRGGATFTQAAFRAQAAPERAEAQVSDRVRGLFQGLTTAQKREIQKLSYVDDETGARLAARDPKIPEPTKGSSLQARATTVRGLLRDLDRRQSELGIRDPQKGELYASGLFWPMRQVDRRVPVFANQELQQAAASGDELSVVEAARKVARARSPFSSAVAKPGRKTVPTILEPGVEEALHSDYDPAFQVERHMVETERAIANERARIGLESVPNVNPATGRQRTWTPPGGDQTALNARVPLYYALERETNPLIFGPGEAGHASMERYIDQAATAESRRLASQDPDLRTFASERGVDPARLGSAGLVARALAPYRSRLQEATQTQRGTERLASGVGGIAERTGEQTRKTLLGPISRIAAGAQRVGADLGRQSGALQETLAQNLTAASTAHQAARGASDAATQHRQQAFVLERLAKDPMTPTQRSIADLARQRQSAEAEEFARRDPGPQSITPDWVWSGKRWKVAGEFADVPRRYLDLSKKPTMPPVQTENLVARVHGNIDDVATQVGFESEDELREWLNRNPAPPTIKSYLGDAEQQLTSQVRKAFSERRTDTLARMGLAHLSLDEALAHVSKEARLMDTAAQRYATEAGQREFAEREFGPRVRGAVATGERAQKTLGELTENAWDAGARAVRAAEEPVDRAAAAAAGLDAKQAVRVEKLSRDYKRAAAEAETAAEFAHYAQKYYKGVFEEIAQKVRAEAPKVPEGYTRESALGLGSPSGKEMALDDSFERFFTGGKGLSPREHESAAKFWQSLQVMNRLSRMSIVLVPTVHGINNLGMHYLAEGGDPVRMAEILAGRATFPEALKERAYAAGAATDWARRSFELGTGANATTAIPERAAMMSRKAGPFARALQPIAAGGLKVGEGYDALNRWLFRDVEQGYAVDLFDQFTKAGMSDGDAAIRVRDALGRYDNITPRELAWNLNRIFYFLPWAKTAVAFWTKKGVLDPKWWSAPVRAIQENNTAQGYDDPSKPFTATLGKRPDGEFRRYTIPVPQRVTENIAELARLPLDAIQAARGKASFADAIADAKAPANYVAGHLNFLGQLATDAFSAATEGANRVAPYNTFRADPNKTGPEQLEETGGKVLSRVLSPFSRVQNVTDDPVAGIAAYLTGAFTYGVKPKSQVAHEREVRALAGSLFHQALAAAQQRGDSAEVQRLTALREAAIRRALAPAPARPASTIAPLPVHPKGADPFLEP